MELHLIHRWSTHTYKSISTPVADDHLVWQLTVPEMSFKHNFLLNGLLAMSAFDMARLRKRSRARYVSAALEYQDLAFHDFRVQLREAMSNSHEAVLYFSLLLVPLALASSQVEALGGVPDSKVQNTIVQSELLRGVGMVLLNQPKCASILPIFRNVKPISDLPRVPLETGTAMALGKLHELNEKRSPPIRGKHCEGRTDADLYSGCRKALFWLSECFATCLDVRYQGYCVAWVGLAGSDYILAVKKKDSVALLILMYWGVLVDLLGHDYWWAKGFGKSLIKEVSGEIWCGADGMTRDVIAWAQEEVHRNLNKDGG